MRLLLKYIETRGSGKEIHESRFEGDTATIGRGTDQTIQAPGHRLPLAHSRLTMSNGKLGISAVGDYRFSVNGESTSRATLKENDQVDISEHRLRVMAPEGDVDYVLEIELATGQVEQLRDRFQTRLWQVGVPERQFAWLLFLTLLLATLIIPASGLINNMQLLRDLPLPDDGMWTTGELHQTHAFLQDNCEYCHAVPFVAVRDDECLLCHSQVHDHFDTEKLGREYRQGDRCANCHREHSTTNSITRTDQQVCDTCHVDLPAAGFNSEELRPATDFYSDHPAFKVTLLKFGSDQEWHTYRFDVWDDEVMEESNLKFPHDIHLTEEGIESPQGLVVMECKNCHVAEVGGLKMRSVTMQSHCADCHQLTFDPDSPDRVVPHGSPADLMVTLREYYALRFLNQTLPDLEAETDTPQTDEQPIRSVRRPGHSPRPTLITDLITESDIDHKNAIGEQARTYIEARVADAAANLFEKQTCTICHQITRVDERAVPWQIVPVKISSDWYPMSVFSHESHKTMECDACHDAAYSVEASDILMPDIGSCRTCHGGERSDGYLKSGCATCHNFHLEHQRPMSELAETATEQE